MENVGWEIRPAGWVLLIVILCLLIYYIANRRRGPLDNNR